MPQRSFLQDINLNQNQLVFPRIHSLASAPGAPAPVGGQMYYNTADNNLYVWDTVGWIDLTSTGVTNLSLGTVTATTVDVDSDSGTNATLVSASTTDAGLLTAAKWDEIVANTAKVSNVTTNLTTAYTATTFTIESSDGTDALVAQAIASGNAGAMSGADKAKLDGIEALADVTDSTNVDAAGATMNADTSLVGNGYFLDDDTFAADDATKVASQQSIKAYVDNAVTSGMTYKGGYNAATNTPALDTGSPVLEVGDTYTVTAAGTFFSVEVEIGDVLIAEVDSVDAADVNDWTILQKNLDNAVIGPGTAVNNNVVFWDGTSGTLIKDSGLTLSGTNTGDNPGVTSVTGGTGIDSSGGTTPDISLNVSELGVATMVAGDWIVFDNAGVSNKALISAIPLSLFDNDEGWPKKYAASFGNGALTTFTIAAGTHGLGTDGDFIVQTRLLSTEEVVECEIKINNSTGLITINTNEVPATNDLRVIVIG